MWDLILNDKSVTIKIRNILTKYKIIFIIFDEFYEYFILKKNRVKEYTLCIIEKVKKKNYIV